MSKSTIAKYIPAWNKFTAWLLQYNIANPFSVDPNVIALYITFLIQEAEGKHIGPGNIDTAMSAIQFYYEQAGKTKFDTPFISRLKSAAGRLLQPKKSQCEPLDSSDLLRMLKTHLKPQCSLHVRMHLTVFLLMFIGLLRFSDAQQIIVHQECLRFIHNPARVLLGVLLFIPFSKTDQSGDGAWVAIGATGKEFCPVALLQRLLIIGKYQTSSKDNLFVGPLLRPVREFFRPNHHFKLAQTTSTISIKPLNYSAFRASLLALGTHCNLDKHFGMHSARTGGASMAAELGIDARLVCGLGRWKQGTTFQDTYIKMMHGNMLKFFELTKQIWPY